MDVIEQIGAYAGFAAVLGLAILAALYFSQARDVKRLREWAGRAPERAPIIRAPVVARPVPRPPGQATMPPRPPAPPVPRPPGAAPGVPPATPAGGPPPGVPGGPPPPPGLGVPRRPPAPPATPAGQPAPASASAAGAAAPEVKGPTAPDEPAEAGPPAAAPEPALATDAGGESAEAQAPSTATPAAAAGTAVPPKESANGSEEVSQDTAVHSLPPEEDEEEGYEHDEPADDEFEPEEPELYDEPLEPDAPERHWEDTGEMDRGAPVPGRPTIPIGAGRDLDSPRPPAASQPPILPPYSQSRPTGEPPGGPERGGFATTGKILGVVGATCIAAAIVAFAIVQLNGDDGGSGQSASEAAEQRSSNGGETRRSRPAVDPSSVTVAVLNGTTVPGLAAKIGNSIKRRGFQLGTVTNFIDQQRAESVVMYAPGAETAAADVGRRLDIAQRSPVDAESQDIAGDATVVVIAGADQTP